ncbi:MAG: SH3 domain-containing protein [Pseudomonadota bacterium]
MRYILVAFLFMAWAFYELSGGGAFDPDAAREARMAELRLKEPKPISSAEPAPSALPGISTIRESADLRAAPRVTLNLTSLRTAAQAQPTHKTITVPPSATPAPPVAEEDVTAALRAALAEAPVQTAGTSTSSVDTPAILPSLIAPPQAPVAAPAPAPAPAPQPSADIRTVSGTGVNVRGGPGTDFGVVGRLTRGDEIRVLEDNGAGWVRFETPDGATAGWLADFLLTSG